MFHQIHTVEGKKCQSVVGMSALKLTREYPSENQMRRISILVSSANVAKNEHIKTRVTRDTSVD